MFFINFEIFYGYKFLPNKFYISSSSLDLTNIKKCSLYLTVGKWCINPGNIYYISSKLSSFSLNKLWLICYVCNCF